VKSGAKAKPGELDEAGRRVARLSRASTLTTWKAGTDAGLMQDGRNIAMRLWILGNSLMMENF
jgi:hypothetical protein